MYFRSPEGKLQPDPKRFPSGIPALADYVHKLGLKFGIYEDYGNYTCGGYPGVLGHMQVSAGMGMTRVVTRASNEGSRRFHNHSLNQTRLLSKFYIYFSIES